MILGRAEKRIFLHPGGFYFGERDTHVHTLLGSCIAVTLWHPRLRIGGMCHFVLPYRVLGSGDDKLDGRYGDEAIGLFRENARSHGMRLSQYKAKIFGGSNVLNINGKPEEELVGVRNAEAALQLLMAEKVEILVAHVGESGHRRVIFDIGSGDAWVRHEAADGHRMRSTSGVN